MWGERVEWVYWLHVLVETSVHKIKIFSVGYLPCGASNGSACDLLCGK